ncbi:MAG TPA: hypothetical protein VLC46_21135 [Thermoanaerobaculia bacterium]|jgi:hypothetical protein|nr:hypothetical protein [Thermoanaerobaculia bacterium]
MTTVRGRFTRHGGGAIIHFDHPPIPDVVHFAGADWRAKREFHVTLTGTTTMRELTAEPDDVIKRAARSLTFTIVLRGELWHVRENDTRAIIRMCDVRGAEEFFARLEGELQIAVDRPPYHVTLYTIGTLRGIGLATGADLERMGQEITGPERDALMSVIQ